MKDAADYVCCSCHRLMYRVSVVLFKENNYQKAPVDILKNILDFCKRSVDEKEWICKTCHLTLKRGKMPGQAKCNKMTLTRQPPELKDLNCLELRLISQRIPFMKMVGLPRGQQHGIHGPAVNVPAKLDFVCEQFPRLPSESQIVSMKLKRKMTYKSHYLYDYVRPEKVLAALKWLKLHNPLYADIAINETWCDYCKGDDPDMWHAMTNDDSALDGITEKSEGISSSEFMQNREIVLLEKTYDEGMNTLKNMATNKNMTIIDVPRDGNCLFTSIWYCLDRLNMFKGNVAALRSKLATFMRENPNCTSEGMQYRDFLAARIESDDLFNADTEQPNDEDRAINLIYDVETQKEIRWIKYLDNLESGLQWGEHLAVKALAEMFQINIHIIATDNPDMAPIFPIRGTGTDDIHLGLIQQYQYVA